MKIVSAMLKTNRYRVMNALLRGLLENLVCRVVFHSLSAFFMTYNTTYILYSTLGMGSRNFGSYDEKD